MAITKKKRKKAPGTTPILRFAVPFDSTAPVRGGSAQLLSHIQGSLQPIPPPSEHRKP